MAFALMNSMSFIPASAAAPAAAASPHAAHSRAPVVFGSLKSTPKVVRRLLRSPTLKTMALASENGENRLAVEKRQNGTPAPASRSQGKRDISPFRAFDLWDPFAPPSSSLVQMLKFMDDFMDDNLVIAGQNRGTKDRRTPWDVVEDKETFSLRIDMPGLTKEDVKVSVEDTSLVVKGEKLVVVDEKEKEKEQDKWASRSYGSYNYRVALPKKVKTEEIKAELKDGVLYVTVPKLSEESKAVDIQVS